MKTYTVEGIRRANSSDVTLEILAESEANARAKAELQDIVVTNIRATSASGSVNPAMSVSARLDPGESIDRGFCFDCGEVPVKTTGTGYHPKWHGVLFHLFMLLITAGGWIFFWIGWAIAHWQRKGERRCMSCGQLLQKQ